MPLNKKYIWGSALLALLLCVAQIIGNSIILLGVLACFIAFLAWACLENYTLPILLFFLPWASILRLSTESYSFYTFGLVMISLMCIIKKQFRFKNMYLTTGLIITLLTLLAKLLNGHFLTFDYIAFMMLLFVFPVVKEEYLAGKYDFYVVVIFLSLGTIIAALCAKQFMGYPNIRDYINVHSYLNITRMTGFYDDPNFYAAQITAASGGCFFLILKQTERKRILFIALLLVLLLYCGILSGSKSFAMVFALIAGLWYLEIVRMRGRFGLKVVLIIGSILLATYVAGSAVFGGWIQVIITRFSFATDFSSFTTGRTELWNNYFHAISSDVKLALLGQGFSQTLVKGRASHSTILQIIYQFGLLGAPVLCTWIVFFFRDTFNYGKIKKGQLLSVLMIATGVFLPWMAIDALFFDEFFLFQMYVFVALQEMRVSAPRQLSPEGQPMARPRRSSIRFVWRS